MQAPKSDHALGLHDESLPPIAAQQLEGASAITFAGSEFLLGGALGAEVWMRAVNSDAWRSFTWDQEAGWDPLLLPVADGALLLGGRSAPAKPHGTRVALLRYVNDHFVVAPCVPLPYGAAALAGAAAGSRLAVCLSPAASTGSPVLLLATATGGEFAWTPGVLPSGGGIGPTAMASLPLADGSPGFTLLSSTEDGTSSGLWHGAGVVDDWKRCVDPPTEIRAPWIRAFGSAHLLVGDRSRSTVLAWHVYTDTWVEAGALPHAPGGLPVRFIADRAPGTASLGLFDAVVLVAYLALVLAIGARFSKRGKHSDDWFVAGRRIPAWAAGFSILATQISAITFLATPAVAFATDWALLPSWFGMLLFAPVAVLVFLPLFRKLRAPTAYSWLEDRFGSGVRVFGASSFLVFQIARMAVVTYLPALAVAHATGLPHEICIVICGAIAILYTVFGGMEAVIWTDVLQAFVVFGGALAAITVLVIGSGGPAEVWSAASAAGKTRVWNPDWSVYADAGWLMLVGGWFLQFGPYSADQAIVQRYLTTKDQKSAGRAIYLNGWLSVPVGFLFLLIGACLWAWFRSHPEVLQVGMTNDEVFPLFIAEGLPSGLGGVILAALAAASMSTLDSGMHSSATVLTHDFWLRFRRHQPNDVEILQVARRFVVAAGVLATGIALALAAGEVRSLLFFFLKVRGLVMSGVAGVFTLGVLVPRAGSAAALAGAAACTLLLAALAFTTQVNLFLYPLAGIPCCVAVGWLISLAAPVARRA